MPATDMLRKKYTPTIGIECHVQLKTLTKLFAAVGNDARGAAPNTLISHICLGLPGALPVLNEAAVKLASRAAFALGTTPQSVSVFERKHYFYPDLPMGYQISQLHQPIIVGGQVEIEVDGKSKTIGIERAQLEADAGKNTHPEGADYTLVDLNRAGTPLLEIVSQPEIHSAAEAKAFARELYLRMKFAGVSDCDLYHGNMRFDVNISVSSKPETLGTRAEVKNLNSFRSVENAVTYEVERQIELLEKGGTIKQETRGWDEAKQKTTAQRGKEEAHDYRYFPDPDIPPVVLDEDYIKAVRDATPLLPNDWRQLFKKLAMDQQLMETLLDVEVEDEGISYLEIIHASQDDTKRATAYANWIINILVPARREGRLPVIESQKRQQILDGVYDLQADGKLNSNATRSLLLLLLENDNLPPALEKYAEEQGLIQMSDTKAIEKIVTEVIADNQQAAEDIKNGQTKAIGFLTGQVMKKSLGKANPSVAQEFIRKELGL